MPQFKQLPDGSAGIEGAAGGTAEIIPVMAVWTAASVDMTIFTATRPMVIQAITARIDVAGVDASAVTAAIKKAASATAIASGTAVHSGTINLKGTANANQVLTLNTDASVRLAAGDSLCIDFTGVLTSAAGSVTVMLNPA